MDGSEAPPLDLQTEPRVKLPNREAPDSRAVSSKRKLLASILAAGLFTAVPLAAQPAAVPTTRPLNVSAVPPELAGRNVDEVRIIGKGKALSSTLLSEISAQVRTREGAPFDPQTVEGDYQRIYRLRRFSNVEARVEPTRTGVVVIYEVTEQAPVRELRFRGNDSIDTQTLINAVEVKPGEAIDAFRLSLAAEAIKRVYQSKNFPYTRVELDPESLRSGIVLFNVIEGPKVRVKKVQVLGNTTFADSRLKDQVRTKAYFPIFAGGNFDPDQLERDVAAIRQFYTDKGFFDVRVGRKVVVSPDSKEVMVQFLVDEGPRYVVDKVTFRGATAVTEQQLRKELRLVEGRVYDADLVKRDTREIVRAYSPYGYIHVAGDPNPDPNYLRIDEQRVFQREPGKVELVYNIHEGKPFQLGRIIVKGNSKTQDKVVLREMRGVTPGELYNSSNVARSQDRIRGTNLFSAVTITPIKTDTENDNIRDLLVEVQETQTAKFIIGAGVTSNSGILGQISYEQRNFDISNPPDSLSEAFSNRAWTGAGQTFRISLEPGTELTRARVDFIEPYLFDQPYRLGLSAYLSSRIRRDWTEARAGGRVSLGRRFGDHWSASVSLRGEDVEITNIDNDELRAREIVEAEGHHTLTSVGLEVRRNTTNSVILPSEGSIFGFSYERVGALGGEYDFDKFSVEANWYTTLYEDLLDRKTTVSLRTDLGYINGDAPFFERYYAGGIGSVRGFRYRGISPRSGVDDDPIGGDFSLTATAELNFPLAGDALRGVLFVDAGTVTDDFLDLADLRVAAGFGFRLTLPFFGQVPIALDFGFPLVKDEDDDTRVFSFSLGLAQ